MYSWTIVCTQYGVWTIRHKNRNSNNSQLLLDICGSVSWVINTVCCWHNNRLWKDVYVLDIDITVMLASTWTQCTDCDIPSVKDDFAATNECSATKESWFTCICMLPFSNLKILFKLIHFLHAVLAPLRSYRWRCLHYLFLMLMSRFIYQSIMYKTFLSQE